jgi:hypothetical protein
MALATLTSANTSQYMAAYNNPNSVVANPPLPVSYNSYPRPAGSPDINQLVSMDGFGPMTIFKGRIVGFTANGCIKQV